MEASRLVSNTAAHDYDLLEVITITIPPLDCSRLSDKSLRLRAVVFKLPHPTELYYYKRGVTDWSALSGIDRLLT